MKRAAQGCVLQHARTGAQLVLVDDGDVLIHGGEAGWDGNKNRPHHVDVDERWLRSNSCRVEGEAAEAPPPTAVRWDHAAKALVPVTRWPGKPTFGRVGLPGRGRVVAGGSHTEDIGKFGHRPVVEARAVVEVGSRTRALALSAARAEPTLTLLRDGRVVVSGGYSVGMDYSWEDVYEGMSEVDVIDVERGTVATGARLSVARYHHAVLEVAPGRLLVVGGARKDGSPIPDIELLTVR